MATRLDETPIAAPARPPRRHVGDVGIDESTPRQLSDRRLVVRGIQLALVAVVVTLWEVGTRQGWIDQFFWGRPSEIASTFVDVARDGRLAIDTWFTVQAALVGFVAGTALGSAIGLSLWWSALGSRVVQPFIIGFHAMPKAAMAPLFVLLFGLGLTSKVAIVVTMTVIVTTLSAYAGVRAVDPDLLTLMDSLGATRAQTFRKIVVPSAAPWIVSALRINIGLSLTGAVVGEMVASQHGLGRLIFYASTIYDASLIWVATFTLSAVAVTMYLVISWVERVLLRGVLHATAPATRR